MDIALNPFMDAILREHVIRVARRKGVPLADLEDLLQDEADAIEYLKECGVEVYLAYLEASSAAVDHVGWVVQPAGRGARSEA